MATITYKSNDLVTTTQSISPAGTVKIEQDSFIVTKANEAFKFEPGAWNVNVYGFVSGAGLGMSFLTDAGIILTKNSKLTVGTEGTVESHGAFAAIKTSQALDVVNSGQIHGDTFGIQVVKDGPSTAKGFTITNNASGEILGDSGPAIQNDHPAWLLTIKNQGRIDGFGEAIHFSEGGLNLTNSGNILGTIYSAGGGGAATIVNSGLITKIDISNAGDTVKNTGIIEGDVLLYNGKNSLTNSNFIGGDAGFGSNDDTMVNTGTVIGSVNLQGGNNTFNNGGEIGSLMMGSGNDTITFTAKGAVGSDIDLGEGLNKLTNDGLIDGKVTGGDNVDTVKNTGTITGLIDLGKDNDSFTGGDTSEQVKDNLGNDVYKLGGGSDLYFAIGSGNDTIDGGAGSDTFDASGSTTEGYVINLDTKTVLLDTETMKGNTAFTFATKQGGSFKGFEIITGTDKSDFIGGGAAAENFDGGAGIDRLAGGLGADTLTGGANADIFYYYGIKDSGATKATRDTITDFDTADGDIIYLELIDANTKTAGVNDDFNFLGVGFDKAFVNAGDLRAIQENGHTILQGDVNGDHKADFSIDLVGTIALTSGDIIG